MSGAIIYGESWDTFVAADLNRPGTIVEMADGRVLLVGSVNSEGGVCGCCGEVRGPEIIARYRTVELPVSLKPEVG